MKNCHNISRSSQSVWIWIAIISMAFAGCDKIKPIWQTLTQSTASRQIVESKELIYQTISAELTLAQSNKPYLVFNILDSTLDVKVKGALVLRVKLDPVEENRNALSEFVQHFAGGSGQLVRSLAGTYLFAAEKQTPDSILKIVSDVTMFKQELMQRAIPSRFRIFWDDKLLLDVVSDSVSAKQPTDVQTKIEKAMVEARYVLRRPFGATLLVLRVKPEEAITLYRISEPGLPVLLQLVSTKEPPPPPTQPKKKK